MLGTTLLDGRIIRFYGKTLESTWAEVEWVDDRPVIFVDPDLFSRDADMIRETLVHEMVHCIEFYFEREWKFVDRYENCSPAATLIGRHLPKMMQNFRPGPYQRSKEFSKPRSSAKRAARR